MNDLLGFLTDVTVAAAITTASHFGFIDNPEPRTAAAEARSVRRTTVESASGRPAPHAVRHAHR